MTAARGRAFNATFVTDPNIYKPKQVRGGKSEDSWLVRGLIRLALGGLFVAAVLWSVMNNRPQRPEKTVEPSYVRGEQPGSLLVWDPAGGDPAAVTIDVPLVVGRMREIPGDRKFIVIFTASGLLRSKVGPLAEGSRFAVHDGALVIAEPGRVQMQDLRPGMAAKTAKLSGAAKRLCVGKDTRDLMLEDDAGAHVVDVAAGSLRAAPPLDCAERSASGGAPKLPGVATARVFVADKVGVVVGIDEATSRSMIAGGFVVGADKVAWQTPIAADPQAGWDPTSTREVLAGGRLIATYDGREVQRRITALDAATGERLWDAPVREIIGGDPFAGLVATDRHVLVVRSTSVEVYDAATGALITTIGSDGYQRSR